MDYTESPYFKNYSFPLIDDIHFLQQSFTHLVQRARAAFLAKLFETGINWGFRVTKLLGFREFVYFIS